MGGTMKDLKGKIVLVTGSASGIGRATALEFARRGCVLALVDINEQGLQVCKEAVQAMGARAEIFICDVSNKEAMAKLASDVKSSLGGVDVLVNCAGVGVVGDSREIKLEDWEWIIRINLWGVIYGVHFFLPTLLERKGHIVNISSIGGIVGMAHFTPYCTTKFAVFGMSECLRADLANFGVGVTVVCPGIINTNITRASRIYSVTEKEKTFSQKAIDFYSARGWPPEKVARAIVRAVRKNKFLCIVGPESWFLYFLKRIAPSLVWRLGALGTKQLR